MCFHFYRMRQWIDETPTHTEWQRIDDTHTHTITRKQIHVTSLSCRSFFSARVISRGDWFDRPCSGIPKSPSVELHEFSPILVSTADIHAVAIFAQVACINIFEAGLGDCGLLSHANSSGLCFVGLSARKRGFLVKDQRRVNGRCDEAQPGLPADAPGYVYSCLF